MLNIRIREKRKEKRWTLFALATCVDINEGTMSKIESGTLVPSLALLEKLTNALHMGVTFPEMKSYIHDKKLRKFMDKIGGDDE